MLKFNNNQLNFNSKKESIDILKGYFQNFDIKELKYYLNNYNCESIPSFLESNVYDPEDIEIKNVLFEHYKIAIKKILYLTTLFNINRSPIKFSFVTKSIYWSELFAIENTIFIGYSYLKKIFEQIEYNLYKSIDDVYIDNNKIFDLEFLKKISECIYSILQYLNQDQWHDYICEKYNCCFIDILKIKFNTKYKILQDPNTSFIKNKILIYWLSSNKVYAVFNSICSKLSFSPYWEKNIIELSYNDGEFEEIIKNESFENIKLDLESNPFVFKAKQITNSIIHNK